LGGDENDTSENETSSSCGRHRASGPRGHHTCYQGEDFDPGTPPDQEPNSDNYVALRFSLMLPRNYTSGSFPLMVILRGGGAGSCTGTDGQVVTCTQHGSLGERSAKPVAKVLDCTMDWIDSVETNRQSPAGTPSPASCLAVVDEPPIPNPPPCENQGLAPWS